MRLWTVHPRYLDTRGLLALWREGLLAQKVLRGATTGYRNHPQLKRFKAQPDPVATIGSYLQCVYDEAVARGYNFDKRKIRRRRTVMKMRCTSGQLLYEWEHLKKKLVERDRNRYTELIKIAAPEPHPLFEVVTGKVEDWEIVQARSAGSSSGR